ncbi:surface protein [Wufeng Crocidura attenuata orthohepadnavirus 1]|nr:preS/S protein [Shrew hepatitis B virus]UOX72951.1 surface protein [Wufeng Crocidura attenuata orthohepadnavirus 1]
MGNAVDLLGSSLAAGQSYGASQGEDFNPLMDLGRLLSKVNPYSRLDTYGDWDLKRGNYYQDTSILQGQGQKPRPPVIPVQPPSPPTRGPNRVPPLKPPQPGTKRLPINSSQVFPTSSMLRPDHHITPLSKEIKNPPPVPSSASKLLVPVENSASSPSLEKTEIGAPVLEAMTAEPASRFLGPLGGLPVVLFLWTRIQEILQNLDWWWTSLSFPGVSRECPGLDSQSQTSRHSLTSCPPTCSGYPWMCRRRFIILLCLLLLCLTCWLGYLDYSGELPVCPLGMSGEVTTVQCKSCTASATGTLGKPLCCCLKSSGGGNCTCVPIPPSWAFAKFLWELVSHHFSWLSSLLRLFQWLEGISPTVLLLAIWMIWYWVPSLSTIFNLFIPLCLTLWYIWG